MKRLIVLRKLKKTKRYDVCVGFSDSACIANILSGKKHCRIVNAVHNTLSEKERRKEYKYIISPLVKYLYNKSDLIIAVSEGVKNDLLRNYGIDQARIKVIYNGCDFCKIDAEKDCPLTPYEKKIIENRFLFVTMGRLDLAKAQWHLIRAFSRIAGQMPDARLLILGEGDFKAYLETMVKDLHLTEQVIFGGFQSNPFHILSKCRVFVFPSLYEGFPNAMIEAMYSGLPIIAADFHAGAREALAPDSDLNKNLKNEIEYASYGILTPVCDGIRYKANDMLTKEEVLLSEAMLTLFQSKEMREHYARKARERSFVYNMELFGAQWKEALDIKQGGDVNEISDVC